MHEPAYQNSCFSQLIRLTQPQEQRQLQGDLELLELYVGVGDRAAIEALITRYGPMVASVCPLTVADRQLAEDAFQATFLILLRQACKIRRRASVAAWLHGVAYRCACRLRKQNRARAQDSVGDDVTMVSQPASDPLIELSRQMNLEALDRELQTLPEHLRAPLVEHYLLGFTAPQIAERMELSVSAVEGRLRRGRQTLRVRLARRGISLSVLAAGCSLFQEHLSAAECSQWLTHFNKAYLPNGNVAHVDGVSSTPPGPRISSLVHGETYMYGSSSIKAALAAGILLTGGAVVALSAGAGGRFQDQDNNQPTGNQVLTIPTVDAQQSVVAQLGPAPTTGQPATSVTTQLQTVNEAQFKEAKPFEWQRPELAEAGEPSWLAGGRTALDDIERNRECLYQKFEFEFKQTSLQEVARWLTEQTGTDFVLNVAEIELEGLADIDSPITAKGRGSVREILRQILDPLEMTYIVNESNIELTTKDNANEEPRIRFYDLSYILPNSANLTALTAAIGQSVAPLDWDTQGGQSTMSIVGSMMIVSAPDMTHHRIEMMLSNISKMNPRNAAQAAQFGSQGGSGGAAMGPAANSGGLGGGLGGGMF